MNTSSDKTCPFCKGLNRCRADSSKPCWCYDLPIPASLTELVPEHLKRKSCICRNCINLYNENAQLFKQTYLLS
ncbi:cysteine-rich CWC family protein [Psychromonas aquimarina]|uniref:cysteine-rich CWC family protein n=1 Tax=Psychromonas aquimarina TaxID=444919 RepID=UPI000400E726|nr:cysteine-rich CWC family protein [Psychromonas aquimarina]